MRCEEAMEWMSARLDGELDAAQEETLAAHLRDCPDCRRLAEAMEGLEDRLSALREPAPEGLKKGVLHRIDLATGKAKGPGRRLFGPGTAIGAVAAVLVLLVGLGVFPLGRTAKARSADEATRSITLDRTNSDGLPTMGAVETNVFVLPEQADGDAALPPIQGLWEEHRGSSPQGGSSEAEPEENSLTEPLRVLCAELSREQDAAVLLYTEFSAESLFGLLERDAPALYELTETMQAVEENGLLRYETDYGTVLKLHEWLLSNLPRSDEESTADRLKEGQLIRRMEELYPGSGSLYQVVQWAAPTSPVSWPAQWPADWAEHFLNEENWALFFPEEDFVPASNKAACLVFKAEP